MESNNTQRSKSIPGYLSPLDGVRGIATLMIFFFHLWQQSWIGYSLKIGEDKFLFDLWDLQKYGFIAIDILFVLSGFCLFYPVARAMFKETQETSLKTFYIKRARRIWPSYCILLLLTILIPAYSYAVPTDNPAAAFKHYFSHLLFIHNFWPDTLGSTLSTAWTMPIEVQFYLVFPLISYFFKKKPVLTFGVLFVVTQCLRFLLCATQNINAFNQGFTFYYLDIFAWGMLSAYFVVYARNKLKNLDKLAPLMTLISLVCVYIAWQFIQWMDCSRLPDAYFRMVYRFILCGAVAVFLFASCYSVKLWQKRILGNRFLAFMSTISYSFYLCHQNINILLKRLNIPYTTVKPVTSDRTAMEGFSLLTIVLSVTVAVLLTYLVEQPIAKWGYKEYFKRIPRVIAGKIGKFKIELSAPKDIEG